MSRDRRGDPELPPGPGRDLIDLFRRLRFARQLSGGQLAVKTGLSAGHVSDVLNGWKSPGPDTAMKLASALGGTVEEVKLAGKLAEELAELNRYQRKKARTDQIRTGQILPSRGGSGAEHAAATASNAFAGSRPAARVLTSSEVSRHRVTGLPGQPSRYIGTVTGDIRRVRCAEVWVNPENTEMMMARFNDFSVSSIVRYEGATRDEFGRVTDDRIAAELARKVGDRLPVRPATAIVTGPGELARYGVRSVVHVAAVHGEPGAGFRQIREVGRCVTNVMTEVDKIIAGPSLRTILFPLLGAGQGQGEPEATMTALAGAAIDYFASVPSSGITTVYFLAYTDAELKACERSISASKRLIKVLDDSACS